jgi:hypothetical protein
VGQEQDLAGAAGRVDAELAADQVGGGLGHGPQGGRLAAGDGDEALGPVGGVWSKHLKVRDSSRPSPPPAAISGRAADQAARSAADATAGTSGAAGARVQQPVVATGGAGGELSPLDQQHPQPSQGQVVGERATGAATTDDQHPRRVHGREHRLPP